MPTGLTSPVHLFVIIFVALIVLGPEKLPHALRQVGRTLGEVRRWSDTISSEMRGALSLDEDDDAAGDPPTVLTAPGAPSPNGNGARAPVAPHPPPAPEWVAVAAGAQAATEQPSIHPALQEGGEWH